jgi:hypothetical protein
MTIDEVEQQQMRDILHELRVAEAWMDQELPQVQDRSALWTDNQRSHPSDVSQGITHAITVAVDHLHAMRMTLTGVAPNRIDLHAHAPFTLLRAALIAAMSGHPIMAAPTPLLRLSGARRKEPAASPTHSHHSNTCTPVS